MSLAYASELKVAIEAVRRASRVCRAVQSEITPEVLSKKDRSPVTVADFSSQALICRDLLAGFPADPVVAEEDSASLREPGNAGFLERVQYHLAREGASATPDEICRWIDHGGAQTYSKRFWTLDPIDGTKGFIRREQYAVSLALIVDGRIVVSALGCPNLPFDPEAPGSGGAIFFAVAGRGASVVPLDGDAPAVPVRVNPQTQPARARFCESVESGHSSHSESAQVAERLGISADPVRLDSQAKYAVVARGGAEIYLRLPTRADYAEKIWDHAGGVLIVTEAGGTVTDVAGKPLEFTHGRELAANRGVIVTNGALHQSVLAALAAVGIR
jgi:3'(2'), 5'-bisphosphate nucleotidase